MLASSCDEMQVASIRQMAGSGSWRDIGFVELPERIVKYEPLCIRTEDCVITTRAETAD
jgi:hypothetical protein